MPTSKQRQIPVKAPITSGRLPDLPIKVPMFRAAATFGVSRSSIYRAAAAGHIRLTKIGRSTLVDTESVLAWLNGLPPVKQNIAV